MQAPSGVQQSCDLGWEHAFLKCLDAVQQERMLRCINPR